ncbi:cardiolipin synthase [Enterococcus sp. DIV0876]|uniref:cardiolipin synthase n=1 Tax=Enterococcus sp. DIV0876 TaxID=2774633 RepID=UPI003D2FBCD5
MKNKLQQFAILTLFMMTVVILLFVFVPQFIYVTIVVECFALLASMHLIFFDQRPVSAKFAWILTILLIPYAGLLCFLLIGKNPRSRKIPQLQRNSESLLQQKVAEIVEKEHAYFNERHPLSHELFCLSGKHALMGNQLDVFHDGKQAFDQILADIEAAQHHIHVFYFIIKGDRTGAKLLQLLAKKAATGVKVKLMYDSLGSIKLPYDMLRPLEESGGEVRPYDLVNSPLLSTRINWRNHRKMVVVDGKIAHIGGMNIGNEYLSQTDKFRYWRDTNMRMSGLAVLEVQEVFIYDWLFLDPDQSTIGDFLSDVTLYFPTSQRCMQGETVQIIYGGPYDSERVIRDAFIDSIGKAAKSIKLAMPYFVPDEESFSALRRAARCGIQVQVIIPGKGDRGVSFHGSNSFIDRLMDAGIEVYFYDPRSFIHCKVMIVDDEIATIGSTNFDMRSFYLNHELSAFIYGPSKTIDALIQQFSVDLAKSISIDQLRQERTVLTIIKERLSALFIPLL